VSHGARKTTVARNDREYWGEQRVGAPPKISPNVSAYHSLEKVGITAPHILFKNYGVIS